MNIFLLRGYPTLAIIGDFGHINVLIEVVQI
jgi:hypothetical protein